MATSYFASETLDGSTSMQTFSRADLFASHFLLFLHISFLPTYLTSSSTMHINYQRERQRFLSQDETDHLIGEISTLYISIRSL